MSDFWHSCISIRSTLTWWKTGATKTHWGDSPLAWVHLAHPTSAPSVRKAGAEEGEICGMFLVRTGTSSLQDLLWALTHSQQLTFSRRPTPSRQATLKPASWFPWHFCRSEDRSSSPSQLPTLSEYHQSLFPCLSQDTTLPMQMHWLDQGEFHQHLFQEGRRWFRASRNHTAGHFLLISWTIFKTAVTYSSYISSSQDMQ